MQTIDNSLLQAVVDENGAALAHLISITDGCDYFANTETHNKASIIFGKQNHDQNLAVDLPWTVVDKGDARVSLTLIDTQKSYEKFAYHFEIITTYSLEGNQLNISFHVKNNSNKAMPFVLSWLLPIIGEADEKNINQIKFNNQNHAISISSSEMNLTVKDKQLVCQANQKELVANSDQKFSLNVTIE